MDLHRVIFPCIQENLKLGGKFSQGYFFNRIRKILMGRLFSMKILPNQAYYREGENFEEIVEKILEKIVFSRKKVIR